MPVETKAVEKSWEPATFEVEADRIRQYADAVGEESEVYHDPEAAKAAGFRDLVAPPMFAVVYSAPAMGPAILDPEVGINLPTMVQGDLRAGRQGLLRVRVGIRQPGRCADRQGHLDQHRPGRLRRNEWATSSRATRFRNCARLPMRV